MANLAAQPGINDLRTKAVLAVLGRYDALDLTLILVYRIDSVPDSALPFLAWQFDVLSPFWALLAGSAQLVPGAPGPGTPLGEVSGGGFGDALAGITDVAGLESIAPLVEGAPVSPAQLVSTANLRAMLKQAIALHRRRGTPWAIKTAIENLGFPQAFILEGQDSWRGTQWPAGQGWAVNRIYIQLFTSTGTPAPAPLPNNNVYFVPRPFVSGGSPARHKLVPVATDPIIGEIIPSGVPIPFGAVEWIRAAFYFFAPRRSWLDLVVFAFAPVADTVEVMDGALVSGSADGFFVTDQLLQTNLGGFSETMLRTPRYDKSYQYTGFEYGPHSVGFVDGALVVNGVPVEV